MSLKDVTVVIPAFNEEEGIASTIEALLENCKELNIIIVDDASTDRTFEIASTYAGITVLRHFTNLGYGASLKTGMRHVRTRVTAWYDADGQHRPVDLIKVVASVLRNETDACLGMRDKQSAFVASRLPGKALLKMISELITRQHIPDLNCGLRAFRTEVIRAFMHMLPSGFSASSTSTIVLLKRGYRVHFEAITAAPRIGHSTVRLRDGIRTLKLTLKLMRIFAGFYFFFFLSSLQIIAGLVYSLYVAFSDRLGIPILGAICLLSGFSTFCFGLISSQLSKLRQQQFEVMARDSAATSPASEATASQRAAA